MAKKKKRSFIRPWCWYCDRTFDDDSTLLLHQKQRHFKCPRCPKKLNTASGLVVHVSQVHKEKIRCVPNTIEGRDSVDIEIFGMTGIPEKDLEDYLKKSEQTNSAAAAAASSSSSNKTRKTDNTAFPAVDAITPNALVAEEPLLDMTASINSALESEKITSPPLHVAATATDNSTAADTDTAPGVLNFLPTLTPPDSSEKKVVNKKQPITAVATTAPINNLVISALPTSYNSAPIMSQVPPNLMPFQPPVLYPSAAQNSFQPPLFNYPYLPTVGFPQHQHQHPRQHQYALSQPFPKNQQTVYQQLPGMPMMPSPPGVRHFAQGYVVPGLQQPPFPFTHRMGQPPPMPPMPPYLSFPHHPLVPPPLPPPQSLPPHLANFYAAQYGGNINSNSQFTQFAPYSHPNASAFPRNIHPFSIPPQLPFNSTATTAATAVAEATTVSLPALQPHEQQLKKSASPSVMSVDASEKSIKSDDMAKISNAEARKLSHEGSKKKATIIASNGDNCGKDAPNAKSLISAGDKTYFKTEFSSDDGTSKPSSSSFTSSSVLSQPISSNTSTTTSITTPPTIVASSSSVLSLITATCESIETESKDSTDKQVTSNQT